MKQIYYFKGNKEHGEELMRKLESLGGQRRGVVAGCNTERYYYINESGIIDYESATSTCAELLRRAGTEIKPDAPKASKCEIKPFDKVLVRDRNTDLWDMDFFRKKTNKDSYPYECLRSCYNQCIPYEGNEELLFTVNTKEELDTLPY